MFGRFRHCPLLMYLFIYLEVLQCHYCALPTFLLTTLLTSKPSLMTSTFYPLTSDRLWLVMQLTLGIIASEGYLSIRTAAWIKVNFDQNKRLRIIIIIIIIIIRHTSSHLNQLITFILFQETSVILGRPYPALCIRINFANVAYIRLTPPTWTMRSGDYGADVPVKISEAVIIFVTHGLTWRTTFSYAPVEAKFMLLIITDAAPSYRT